MKNLLYSLLCGLVIMVIVAGCGGGGGTAGLDASQEGSSSDLIAGNFGLTEDGLVAVPVRPDDPVDDDPFSLSGKGASFAQPGELSLPDLTGKSVSFVQDDLDKEGADYDPTLPSQNVVMDAGYAVFSPGWLPGEGGAGLAMATYRFVAPGYAASTELQSVGFEWSKGYDPDFPQDMYVGFANWDEGRWTWYMGPDDSTLTIDSLAPYEREDGTILVALVMMGEKELELGRISLGDPELRGTGLLPKPGEMIAGDYMPPFGTVSLPSSASVEAGMAPVGNQGSVGSCTAWAAGHGALDYQLNFMYQAAGWNLSNWPQNGWNQVSQRYLYLESDLSGLGCPSPGRYTSDVMATLMNQGTPPVILAPYGSSFSCADNFTQATHDEADKFRISNFQYIFSTGNSTLQDVDRIKHTLAILKKPVYMTTSLDDDFSSTKYDKGNVWNYNGPSIGGHAMCIIGYNDAKQAFYVRNSWGSDWGNDGNCWIGYSTFTNAASKSNYVTAVELFLDFNPDLVAAPYCNQTATIYPPANFQASSGEFVDKVRLSWTAASGATSYEIYRGTDDNLIDEISPESTSYDDTTAVPGVPYAYWIKTKVGGFASVAASDTGFRAADPFIRDVLPLSGRSESLIQFSADVIGNGTLTYAWDFGGGAVPNTSTEPSPTVVLTGDDIYDATLEVTGANGTATYEFQLVVDPVQEEWAHSWGLGDDEEIEAVCVDYTGAAYVAGSTIGGLGDRDALVVKYDAGGNVIWSRAYGTGGRDNARGIVADNLGNIYVAYSEIKAGAVTSVLSRLDAADGQEEWSISLGIGRLSDVATDVNGNVFAVGNNIFGEGNIDILVHGISPAGSLLWSKRWGTSGNDFGEGIDVNSDGQVFVAGQAVVNSSRGSDLLMLQFDPANGDVLAQKSWGNNQNEYDTDVMTDDFGNVYLTATGKNYIFGEHGILVVRYDISNPELSWVRAYDARGGSNVNTYGRGISVDSAGDLFAVTFLDDEVGGEYFHVMAKISAQGTLLREERYEDGTGYPQLEDMAYSAAGKLYVAGTRAKRFTPFWDPVHMGQGNFGNPGVTEASPSLSASGSGAIAKSYPLSAVNLEGTVDNGGGKDDLMIVKFNPEVEN
ncbi:hypothetical protein KDL29_01925 [bacterium]|nr:hypothetical protein [bacterium]